MLHFLDGVSKIGMNFAYLYLRLTVTVFAA